MNVWVHHKPSALRQHHPVALMIRIRDQLRILQARLAKPFSRFLLCRPIGGLNDTLCQIHICIIHSFRFGRNLIIDTTRAGFLDDFSNYFETVTPFANLHTRLDQDHMRLIEQLSCYPHSFQGRLSSYKLTYIPEISNFVDAFSGERPGIAYGDQDYPQELLLHEQCGGGYGCQALPFFRFTQSTSAEITARLSRLPANYIGVTIRHSDVKLDYRSFLQAVKPRVEGRNVLVTTDSYEALVYSKNFLDNATVHDVANIPNVNGRLHENPGVTDRNINIGCLTDLIGLANARAIIIPSGPDVCLSGLELTPL